jgi:hypothetical protein
VPRQRTLAVEAKQYLVSDISFSKLQNEFAAVFSPRGIEELAKPRAGEIVLHVPWIKVIE